MEANRDFETWHADKTQPRRDLSVDWGASTFIVGAMVCWEGNARLRGRGAAVGPHGKPNTWGRTDLTAWAPPTVSPTRRGVSGPVVPSVVNRRPEPRRLSCTALIFDLGCHHLPKIVLYRRVRDPIAPPPAAVVRSATQQRCGPQASRNKPVTANEESLPSPSARAQPLGTESVSLALGLQERALSCIRRKEIYLH